jgi:hypothetical protein
MVFAEYQNPRTSDKVVVEYTPTEHIYSVTEYVNEKACARAFNKTDEYLDYVKKIRKNGYTRKGIY